MIVIDIETSGLEPERNSILSIGAVEFENPSNQFYEECRLRDGAEASPEALAVNGFTMAQINDKTKKSLDEMLHDFKVWTDGVEDRTPAGHNISAFDLAFIRHYSRLYGIGLHFGHRSVDTHGLVYGGHLSRGIKPPLKNNRSDINSDGVMRYVGLPDEPRPHNGLTGAKMEAEAISRLLKGKPLLREYEAFPVPEYLKR